jgi:hypothetical protein
VNTKLLVSLALTALAGSTGCSTTIRSMTATSWVVPPGATAGAAPTAGAPVAAPVAEGAPPPAAAPAPAAAAPGGIASHYYVTYWEGTCSGLSGCSRGDTHVKHCKANADNTLTCNDEAVATKALNP